MKQIFFSLALLLHTVVGVSQQTISYAYDNAGNRIQRVIIVQKAELISEEITSIDETSMYYIESIDTKEVKIFPNPTSGNITVSIPQDLKILGATVQIVSVQGTVIEKRIVENSNEQFDLYSAPSGIYSLLITTPTSQRVWKVIKE